jgi:hypothetical protein
LPSGAAPAGITVCGTCGMPERRYERNELNELIPTLDVRELGIPSETR